MSLLLSGIIHVTGEPDSGKTTFALECGAHPKDIWFLDDDVKGRAVVQQLLDSGVQFGRYDDLAALRRGKRELEFHEACLGLIDSVPPGRYEAVIWDTWSAFAKTCHDWVVAHPDRFRQNWAALGSVKGAQQWQEARRYEAELLHRLAEKVKLVIVVTHLKDHVLNNIRTGKKIPDSSVALERVAVMRLWLRRNPASPVPIALVLKRIDRKMVTPEGIRTVAVLPPKITPRPGERSLWDSIRRYWNEPVGDRPLQPDEIPDEWELSIIRGTLTPDQQRVFELMLRAGVGPDEETLALIADNDPAQKARELREQGKTLAEIAAILQIPVPDVLKLLEER